MSHLRIFGDSFWHVFIETHNPESVFQKNRTPHTHIPMFKKKNHLLLPCCPWLYVSCFFFTRWLPGQVVVVLVLDDYSVSSSEIQRGSLPTVGHVQLHCLGSAAGNRSSVLQARTLSQAEPEAGGESIHVPQCQIHCGCRAEQDLQSPAVSKVSSLRSKTSKEKVKLDSCLLCT